jgi:chromosome segregation ATPase
LGEYGEYAARYLGDYAFQFSLALVAIIAATAAWVVSRRRYVKSIDFKRGFDALRFEFRRSIDEVRAATARKVAGISDNLLSISSQMDSSVTDLNVRLARLEEYADAIEAFMAGPQKQVLRQNEEIDARLRKLEQRLTALTDQFSLVEQTIDGAGRRDNERNKSIEDINYRLVNAQKQVDELFPRLELGEKARTDLGALIGLFVRQLKRVNITSAETTLRVAELEGLRTKVTGLEQRLSSIVNPENNSVGNNDDFVGNATPNPGSGDINEANAAAENASTFEQRPASAEEAAKEATEGAAKEATEEAIVRVRTYSENGSAGQHPT